MVRTDAEAFIAQVAAFGLVPFSNGVSVDVAFTSHPIGTLVHCDWLELDQFKGRPVAWLKGTDPGNLFILDFELNAPNPLEVISGRELKESYEFLGIENSVEAYRHKTSGEIMYIGRTNDSEPQPPPKPLRRRKWWQFRK